MTLFKGDSETQGSSSNRQETFELGATFELGSKESRQLGHRSAYEYGLAKGKTAKPRQLRLPPALPVIQPRSSSEPCALESSKGSSSFNPDLQQLNLSWSSYAEVICCLNVYPNGVTFSLHNNNRVDERRENQLGKRGGEDITQKGFIPSQFHLRFRDTRDYQLPQGRYFLYRKEVLNAVEKQLSLLQQRGLLKSAVIYFGTVADPFLAFHKRFDITTGCLDLFEHYRPHRLVLQTRSPMIIAALPILKLLGEQAVVVIPVETHLERSVARYMPGKPRISERLLAAQGLRKQKVAVNLCVSPILPYGDPKRDAWDFAELLDRHSDYVTFGCLADGSESNEKQLRSLPIAQKLSTDEQFLCLRPHAYRYVFQAMMNIAPQKLLLPVQPLSKPSQLDLFAA